MDAKKNASLSLDYNGLETENGVAATDPEAKNLLKGI